MFDLSVVLFIACCLKYYSSLLTAWQLAYINPRVYNCSVPMAFHPDIAVMAHICDGETPAIKNRRSLQKLESVRGQTFFSFAKSHNYVDGESSQVQKLSYIFRLMVLQQCIDIALLYVQSTIYLGLCNHASVQDSSSVPTSYLCMTVI